MTKNEIKARVIECLSSGVSKSATFEKLSGQGVKDSQLAYLIASYPNQNQCAAQDKKIDALILIMFVQALLVAIIGYSIGAKIGPNAKWIFSGIMMLIPLLFAWGFYKHRVGAYNAYILLSIVQLPQMFKGFSETPVGTSIGVAISISTLALVYFVRWKIFPDFAWLSPVKVKGKYFVKSNHRAGIATDSTTNAL